MEEMNGWGREVLYLNKHPTSKIQHPVLSGSRLSMNYFLVFPSGLPFCFAGGVLLLGGKSRKCPESWVAQPSTSPQNNNAP
jgi:hypothetical protein